MAEQGQKSSVPTLSAQRLQGKVTLITGAGGSIGLETSARLLLDGANLSLVDISQDALNAAISHLGRFVGDEPIGSRVMTIVADVTAESAVQEYMAKTVKHFGRLDAVFLNAGISYSSTSILDTTEESYERVMRVNVKSGVFYHTICSLSCVHSVNQLSISRHQTCC